MGCVVNGPGEAKDCDIGIAGSKDFCVIFKKGEVFLNVAVCDAVKVFIEEMQKKAHKVSTASSVRIYFFIFSTSKILGYFNYSMFSLKPQAQVVKY